MYHDRSYNMSRKYDIKDSDGAVVIPVSDGDFFTDKMSTTPDRIDVYFSFYSDANAETPVTPSSGTITTSGEYDSGFFLDASGSSVDATTVSTPNATFTPPAIDGRSERVRVNLSGVTGAAFMKAYAYKRG